LLILLESTACIGLKGLLREVTRQARERGDDEDEAGERAGVVDDAGDDERQGESWADKKYFDYDLEWVRQRCLVDGFENVVVAVRDTEAFDGGLLAQAVDVFQYVVRSLLHLPTLFDCG
jgi:origin recognition complex subunit 3